MGEFRPVVIIPSYNTGWRLRRTVEEALEASAPHPVMVVADGSDDGSAGLLGGLLEREGGRLRVFEERENRGKGAAVLLAAREAAGAGKSHALTLDADGQHPAGMIREFFRLGAAAPDVLWAGRPVFGPDAPAERVFWRRLANWLAALETGGAGPGDSLFGMRLYPLAGLLEAFGETRFGRRFDFETEIAARMVWRGWRVREVAVPVCYFRREEGGVSHYRYGRDNLLLAFCHARLLVRRMAGAGRGAPCGGVEFR